MKSLHITCIIILSLLILQVSGQEEGKDSALNAISFAETRIKEMLDLGFSVNYANGTLNEAKLLFSQGKYSAAESLAVYVDVIKQKAIETDELIDYVEEKIYNASLKGIDLSEAQELFNTAAAAFEIENYDEAQRLLYQTINQIDEMEKEAALEFAIEGSKGFGLADLIKYWPYLIASVAAMAIFGFFLQKRIRVMRISNKIKNLEKEKEVVESLIKKTQEKYFVSKTMNKTEYNISSESYGKRLTVLQKDIPVFKKRLEELGRKN